MFACMNQFWQKDINMLISGFSFVRNGDILSYPVAEAIRSVLPLCDEFIIAVGRGDEGDRTREIIVGIGDPKIRIIDTVWENHEGSGGRIYREQTNLALAECRGDWCLYIQCDEAIHERYVGPIRLACEQYREDLRVEGFRFNYKHFWGDYDHYKRDHTFYAWEVRIIRNAIGMQSVGDAQSFRIGKRKPRVVALDAEVFHYGYVRHPDLMGKRNAAVKVNYIGGEAQAVVDAYSYGPLGECLPFIDTHPAVMQDRITAISWRHLLDYSTGRSPSRRKLLRTWLEQTIFDGSQPWGYRTSKILRDRKYRIVGGAR